MGERSATTVNYEWSTQQRIQQVECLTNEVFNRTFQQVGYFKNNEVINRELNKLVTSTRDNHRTNDWLSQQNRIKTTRRISQLSLSKKYRQDYFTPPSTFQTKINSNGHSKNFWKKNQSEHIFLFWKLLHTFLFNQQSKRLNRKRKRGKEAWPAWVRHSNSSTSPSHQKLVDHRPSRGTPSQ